MMKVHSCIADPEGPCLEVAWLCDWCRRSCATPKEGEVK